ncbi:helix-turn-helix domain-containing protein [Pseudorhodoplanes sp.]|uniref:helix-turn-helix domain-containing protein n=1 Tax=Pseudorhodoplanes sp. TaxID=1934341 RepID=UPI003D102056
MEWSSKPSRVDQGFGTWADDLAAAFVRLEPRKIADQPFQGTIARADADPVAVSRVTASRHTVLRLPAHIARSSDDLSFINLQLKGTGRYAQRGHEQVCGPGDLAVVDTTEPFEIANGLDFELFCFAIPRKLLPPGFFERPRLRLAGTEVGRALSRALAGHAELCLASNVPEVLLSASGAHIVDLVCHAPCAIEEEPARRLNAPVLMSMMLDHIAHHSDDCDLSAATLARTFHCSERYVHKLFASTGRSVGEHVNDRRIAACIRDLLVQPKRTIAEIAFAAGFRDISHFNRLFKRLNGTSPREFRRAGPSDAVAMRRRSGTLT